MRSKGQIDTQSSVLRLPKKKTNRFMDSYLLGRDIFEPDAESLSESIFMN